MLFMFGLHWTYPQRKHETHAASVTLGSHSHAASRGVTAVCPHPGRLHGGPPTSWPCPGSKDKLALTSALSALPQNSISAPRETDVSETCSTLICQYFPSRATIMCSHSGTLRPYREKSCVLCLTLGYWYY
jgi:hypothetical protein